MGHTVLFICTGNVCRSPMAEGLFRDLVEKNDADFAVKSAGVGAQDGQPPSENSVRAMQDLGIDITAQRSQMLTAELAAEADMILVPEFMAESRRGFERAESLPASE